MALTSGKSKSIQIYMAKKKKKKIGEEVSESFWYFLFNLSLLLINNCTVLKFRSFFYIRFGFQLIESGIQLPTLGYHVFGLGTRLSGFRSDQFFFLFFSFPDFYCFFFFKMYVNLLQPSTRFFSDFIFYLYQLKVSPNNTACLYQLKSHNTNLFAEIKTYK